VVALAAVRARDDTQQAPRAEAVFRVQPHLFGPALVLAGLDVSLHTSGGVLALVFVGFRAMQASGLTWHVM
jgi:hypothetical protein